MSDAAIFAFACNKCPMRFMDYKRWEAHEHSCGTKTYEPQQYECEYCKTTDPSMHWDRCKQIARLETMKEAVSALRKNHQDAAIALVDLWEDELGKVRFLEIGE